MRPYLLAVSLCLATTSPTPAQSILPAGGQKQVNNMDLGDQDEASVFVEADGTFMVVFASDYFHDTYVRRYAANGTALDGQVRIFDVKSSSSGVDAAGNFVLAWRQDGTDIRAVRIAADGSPLGSSFLVNTYTTGYQAGPAVGVDAEGNFVILWESDGGYGTDTFGRSVQGQRYAADATLGTAAAVHRSVQGQRYASDGTPLAGQFQVNTYTTLLQRVPHVGMEPDGDFIAVWHSQGSSGTDNDDYSIQGQRYAADGTPRGGEFQVNTYTTAAQGEPAVAVGSDGSFIVVWDSFGSSGTDNHANSIQGQRYASDGTPLAGQFQVNTTTTYSQSSPSVAVNAAGDAVVVWESSIFGGYDLQGQAYAPDGTPRDIQFQINTYTTGWQDGLSVALDPDGNFVVAWSSTGSWNSDNDGRSIQLRRYRNTTISIFDDGFESGDTSAWPPPARSTSTAP